MAVYESRPRVVIHNIDELASAIGVGLAGTVTSATSNTLTDTSRDWETDMWKGDLVAIIGGTGKGQVRSITSNTSDTLTVATSWTTIPDSTSKYVILTLSTVEATTQLTRVSGVSLTGRDWSSDFEKLQNIDIALSTITRTRVYEQTFESGETDTTVSGATQIVQSTEVYAGSYALQVTVPAGSTGYIETPQRPVSPNQQVTFAFAHKEDANITDVKLIVVWYRASGGIIDTEEFTLTPSTTWTVDSRTITAPHNSATMSLRMQATAGASDGNVYVDEMTVDLVGQILRVDGAGQVKVADTDLLEEISTQPSFSHGQITVGTTATQLPSAPAVKGVLVKAHRDNTGKVYIGNSSSVSTTNGFELAAGEALTVEVNNANLIWVIADSADQKISWVAV